MRFEEVNQKTWLVTGYLGFIGLNFLEFRPTHDIYEGMKEAIHWYIDETKKGNDV